MRRPNFRLVKIHRSYTVEEVAVLLDVHKGTVRNWINHYGLPVVDKKRPILIRGNSLKNFLEERRARNKRSLKPGEMYCFRCREPRFPFNMEAAIKQVNGHINNLVGQCCLCKTPMNRRISLARLQTAKGSLSVKIPEDLKHLIERG